MNCFLAGVKDAGKSLGETGVVTKISLSEAIQNFIKYLLSFVSLIAVIYVMYAGARLMLNPSDEESSAKTKKIIVSVIAGIAIIWFAWLIVSTIFFVVRNGSKKAFIPVAVAETQIRNVDFTTYSNKIAALKTKLDSGYSPEVMSELSMLVDGAYDHMPDRDDLYKNKQLYDAVTNAIDAYNLRREIIDRGILQTALRDFLEQAKIYTLKSEPEATPRTGDAPLSVTFEAKQTIDESGTVVPNDNYTWWLRTEGGTKKILGKGNITNYTFNTSGTYMVFLTINSASKNSRGFNDVINFQDSVVVEVGQPRINFVVKVNDQRVDGVVKISTKEALKPLRIDASETRFASGYTTKNTEWDFGNGNTDTNEGDPQFEAQQYTPGDHTIKLILTRNDGEEFPYTILLKIGDPLASISTTNQIPHKGEKVVFQAKKTSKEDDVSYLWEVKKQGIETVIHTFSGTRLEYTFLDTGKFFITLTSIKSDARDKDTMEVTVESRPPNVQFTSDVVSSAMPNVYTFDGSNSFDPDYLDNQKLRFEWFVNDAPIQLIETNERNSRGKYTFPEKGTQRVMLRVTDDEGKTKESTRDIKITSILSVQLNIRPEVVKRGAKTLLLAVAPRATIYEWKIGTSEPVRSESNRFTTSFALSGVVPITVTVTDVDGNTNTATGKIYVTEDRQPFSIIDIKSDSSVFSQKSICSGQEALTFDRANSVSLSADKSVNTDGRTDDMTYFWKIGLNKTSTQKNVSYTFDELGCEEIILTVSDKITGASHTSRVWVKVINLTPIFNDISVDVENLDIDPMKINLKVVGAKDPDGLIRSYTWYYYTDKDDQAQGFRITRTPEATFVLPKITGRYYFAVMMEDSNGAKVNTKEVSEVLFSTPELYVNTNLSTPIIENFKADNSEVKFWDVTRLSLDVRTPVASDVSDKAEYRWDIDGDGFYDVKTTTPFYEFKYVYPGEYNPKVKVTHKGISATKTLTIVVKNSLVPKATIQMLGTKIIAYNVSSGIFQSTNWYLDDKKISDNKDYLIFEIEWTGVKNLKLEISDGKVTESVVYPIERSLKNKTLIKKITRPLVVLSPLSGGDVQEAPDEIVWEDPMIPLFLYLWESRGDIRYYVIDTDIDIDTDLSGGKDDDADNKGTASYRSGRPFQITKGTKRVTTMKLRIIGNDNKDIDTRQIRVVRKFLTATESDIVTDTKAPQVFNLSQEDKDRIEKLRNLVQWAPEEEKKEFNKVLDQLGDTWYDVADRIQTLNLFSNMVDASPTLTPDLKRKILEQINLVYTQGDEQMEERQLALKMITEYLAKSPKKSQIFWDDQTQGLINEIIDNPEYYEANLKIIQKIMDDYVDPDATLSAEVKKDIYDKLRILAGSPPAPDNWPTENANGASSNLKLLLWILGGVMCIVFGGVGLIYARQKLTPSNQEMPDNHWDNTPVSPIGDIVTPVSPSANTGDATPDWLKEENSPFGNEDVFSNDTPSSSDSIPDWLQDTPTVAPVNPIPAEELGIVEDIKEPSEASENPVELVVIPEEPIVSESGDIPDWLQGAPSIPEPPQDAMPKFRALWEETIDLLPSENSVMWNDTTVQLIDNADTKAIEEVSSHLKDDDIPDWLRGSESEKELPLQDGTLSKEENIPSEGSGEEVQGIALKKTQSHWKKKKIETMMLNREVSLLESPEHLLVSWEKVLTKKPSKKKISSKKDNTTPSDHLLESEHDMLLPSGTQDNTLS